jgi:hypothetical protein
VGPKSGYLPIYILLISSAALILCMNLWLHGYAALHPNKRKGRTDPCPWLGLKGSAACLQVCGRSLTFINSSFDLSMGSYDGGQNL